MAYAAYTLITATGGGLNAKGAYTQVVAATPFASSRLYVIVEAAAAANRWFLLDIATGAAAAETVVVSNVALYVDTEAFAGMFIPVDVDIPAGSRVAVRVQAGVAASQLTLHVYLEDRALASLANPVTYGALTAVSAGTLVDPGGTASTKGAYVEFSASLPSRLDVVLLFVTPSVTALGAVFRWFLDIATGGAGVETVVLPDVAVLGTTFTDSVRPAILRFPVSIPAGTRLAVRCACNLNTASQRVLRVSLIGMQEPASGGGGSATGAVAYVG